MSQPSPQSIPEPQSVRLDALCGFHGTICDLLAIHAPKAGPPQELAAAGIALQCEQCGLQVSGAEWRAVLLADSPDALGDPRLSRFHQGYCGRKECNSYYYRVSFLPVAGVDWSLILRKASEAAPPPPPPPPAPSRLGFGSGSRRQLALRLGVGGLVIVILLLARRLWTGGSIPLVKPARKFTVDPSSLPPQQPGK
jgi:hypothetical protein